MEKALEDNKDRKYAERDIQRVLDSFTNDAPGFYIKTNFIEKLDKQGCAQCQVDMADKKYTEEDMRKAYQEGKSYVADTQPYFDNFEQFINSLNNQG